MKRVIKLLSAVLTLLFLTGCMQLETLIKVKPDGSGTVEETLLINKTFLKNRRLPIGETIESGTSKTQPKKRVEIFDEAILKEKAEVMGKGVTYISGKKLTTEEAEGYQATYAFTDINNLKISQSPVGKAPDASAGATPQIRFQEGFITFQFTKGPPAILTIKQPSSEPTDKPKTSVEEPPAADKPESQKDEFDELLTSMLQEIFKELLKGINIKMAVEVEGNIIETNAAYREDSRVTLMDIDFNQLLENQEKFKQFYESQHTSIEEIKKLMKDLPGIKVDLNEEVKIKFK